ncbi:MAG: hypothetical protein HY011_33985 [Acidobacteria bacterium]|nr:hypothetical protein [Acidobacteriota bacterium]
MEPDTAHTEDQTERLRNQLLGLPYDQFQQLLYHAPVRPPAQPVTIAVKRDKRGVPTGLVIKGDGLQLTPQEQIVWTCADGKLEIRFSPAATPFLGAEYEAPRAAWLYSGTPRANPSKPLRFTYRILVTTPDGFLFDQPATLAVVKAPPAPTTAPAKSRRRK